MAGQVILDARAFTAAVVLVLLVCVIAIRLAVRVDTLHRQRDDARTEANQLRMRRPRPHRRAPAPPTYAIACDETVVDGRSATERFTADLTKLTEQIRRLP